MNPTKVYYLIVAENEDAPPQLDAFYMLNESDENELHDSYMWLARRCEEVKNSTHSTTRGYRIMQSSGEVLQLVTSVYYQEV